MPTLVSKGPDPITSDYVGREYTCPTTKAKYRLAATDVLEPFVKSPDNSAAMGVLCPCGCRVELKSDWQGKWVEHAST
jgi:hypothetical protein